MEGTDRPPPEEVIDRMATGYMLSSCARARGRLTLQPGALPPRRLSG
jgi:hypothetical protein